MDDEGLIVAAGELGELWLSGSGVGLGYINKPDMTKKSFENILGEDGALITYYKTGDLVRELANGLGLEFGGRFDNQVKIRGHRIELEEIDYAIMTFHGISRALTVVSVGQDGVQNIVVVYCSTLEINENDLQEHCLSTLPLFMVPSRFLAVEEIPVNANGKADRVAVQQIVETELA